MALSDIMRGAEQALNKTAVKIASKRGWVPAISGYTGYGSQHSIRIYGRILAVDPNDSLPLAVDNPDDKSAQRGWRQFLTVQLPDHPFTVTVGDKHIHAHTDDNGYIDISMDNPGLEPGWHKARLSTAGAEDAVADIMIVDSERPVGIISDIDDTILVTWLPRALVAAWNSWIKKTNTRTPVDGMAAFFARLRQAHPDAPIFYLSTGAWNTYRTLKRFMRRHGFPEGPMLLTDWGPTETGLFRNGMEHKKVQLRNLIIDYPHMTWILIGDDGQHDPLIFSEVIKEHPTQIKMVAVRTLSPREHVLSHGTLAPLAEVAKNARATVPIIHGQNGHVLIEEFAAKPFGAKPFEA